MHQGLELSLQNARLLTEASLCVLDVFTPDLDVYIEKDICNKPLSDTRTCSCASASSVKSLQDP